MAEDKFIDKAGMQRYTEKVLEKINNKVDDSATGANSLLSKTSSWTTTPTDDTYFVRQDIYGVNIFGRAKFSTVWAYIKAKVEALGYTKNTGTITGIKMNGSSKGTSGVVDLGTVITSHQDINGKQDKLTAGTNITISGTTISAKDTTYSAATKSAAGLMSAADKTKLDGIATGANKTVVDSGISTTSTNPVQNKAVGLKFQSVDSEFTDMVNVYGAKNLLSLKATVNRVNANGLNVSFLDDGGIRVYGTKTTSANGDLYFIPTAKTTLKPNTKYTLTVANSASNAITARMHLNADGKTVYAIAEKNKTSISFTTPTGSDIYVEVYAVSVTDNNPIDVTVYPMLRYASIKDDTFVPYAMTNRELTEKVIDTGWKTTGNLKYRKSGCVVCLQGTVTPSSGAMSISLGTLPEGCRPSQDINIAQASTDTPSRQIIVTTKGVVTLLFASNCTASHTYAYNGTFMI